jgi:hypothetical protein
LAHHIRILAGLKKGAFLLLFTLAFVNGHSWGFFGHRLINRMAVFTLPEELLAFYKTNIEYITDHAPDPDKRRYAVPEEACRHYIDLDHYEVLAPVDTVPVYWKDAVKMYSEDTLNAYGIVPWYINLMKFRLTTAFKERKVDEVLKLSADIGHYIADAHVPLHATENYNGQLTNQKGIHGFWESRLPELYSNSYDFFTGRARYVSNIQKAAWEACEGSFAAKDSVLEFERRLNSSFAQEQKYTIEQKGQAQIKNYSAAYAKAYDEMLGGQVERRMRLSVLLVGSIWYTAWVDAGQPDMADAARITPVSDEERRKLMEDEKKTLEQKMIGREE